MEMAVSPSSSIASFIPATGQSIDQQIQSVNELIGGTDMMMGQLDSLLADGGRGDWESIIIPDDMLEIELQKVLDSFRNSMRELFTLYNQLDGNLLIWNYEQRQRLCGILTKETVSLKNERMYWGQLWDNVWKLFQHANHAETLFAAYPHTMQLDIRGIASLKNEITIFVQNILNTVFIVQQHPQILKTKTYFSKSVILTLLTGSRKGLVPNFDTLSVRIVSEEQAGNLVIEDDHNVHGVIYKENGPDWVDANSATAEYSKMKLEIPETKPKKKYNSGDSNDLRMEEKFCLYFTCTVTVGNIHFPIHTKAGPIVVVTHGSQSPLAEATIIWDSAFGKISRVPYEVRTSVPWSSVAQILKAQWMEVTGIPLTDTNLACLANKAFRYPYKNDGSDLISWDAVCKNSLPGTNFSLWKWFSCALKLLQKESHLLKLYKEKLVIGIIERHEAEKLLLSQEIGTFLLRFSETMVGAVGTLSISFKSSKGIILNVDPYTLDTKNLGEAIAGHDHLVHLYNYEDTIIPRNVAFASYIRKRRGPYIPFPSTFSKSWWRGKIRAIRKGLKGGKKQKVDSDYMDVSETSIPQVQLVACTTTGAVASPQSEM